MSNNVVNYDSDKRTIQLTIEKLRKILAANAYHLDIGGQPSIFWLEIQDSEEEIP